MFLFFKQKTAYEMRISDWSSDVCSSDLTKDYGSVSVVGSSRIEVYRVASESGYLNTLTAFGSGPISEPGPQPVSGWTPNDLVASTPLFSGDLSGAINFFSNGAGDPLTFNSFQVGIFLPTGFQGSSYQTQHLWVGFDDSRYIDPNDNHDDYIIRISALPASEERRLGKECDRPGRFRG